MFDDEDVLALRRPLGETSAADPADVLSTKTAFNWLGYYDVPPYGLTPYPDQVLFDGIRDYQKDNALNVDGYMLPGGETERSVNSALAAGSKEDENRTDGAGCAEQAVSIPFGWPWPRRDFCPNPSDRDEPTEEECIAQEQRDEATCRQISERYGPYRAQRCWASIPVRWGYCTHNKRLNFPP